MPSKPTNASVLSKNSSQITFQWTPPINIATGNYSVKLSSSFWNETWWEFVNTTSHTFTGLKSGTKYQFEVRTWAGGLKSEPVSIPQSTGENLTLMIVNALLVCKSYITITCFQVCHKVFVLLCFWGDTSFGLLKIMRQKLLIKLFIQGNSWVSSLKVLLVQKKTSPTITLKIIKIWWNSLKRLQYGSRLSHVQLWCIL